VWLLDNTTEVTSHRCQELNAVHVPEEYLAFYLISHVTTFFHTVRYDNIAGNVKQKQQHHYAKMSK